MKPLLLIALISVAVFRSYSQNSTAAKFIDDYVAKIDDGLPNSVVQKKDTVIYDKDSLRRPLIIQTEYFSDPQTMKVAKIVEKSDYQNLETIITVYYHFDMPIRFTSFQKEGKIVKADFDIYYVNNNYVHFTGRNQTKGKPNADIFLEWCMNLLKEYNVMMLLQKQSAPSPSEKFKPKTIWGKPKKNQGKLK